MFLTFNIAIESHIATNKSSFILFSLPIKSTNISSPYALYKSLHYIHVRCYTLSLAYEGMCRHATAILFSLAFEGTNISFPCALYKNLKLHKHNIYINI